jgi:ABC-type sugar transport system substrate-binding protein
MGAVVLISCKKKEEYTPFTVGLGLTGIDSVAIWIDLTDRIAEKCRNADYRLITANFLGEDGQISEEAALAFFKQCLAEKVRVVLFQNIAEDIYADLLLQLKEQGAVLGAMDIVSSIAQYNSEVKNYEAGLFAGRECGKWVHENPGSKKVGVCTYSTIEIFVIRAQGLKDGFKETCPEGEIVFEADAGMIVQGVTVGKTIINTYPDIQAVMGFNDAGPLGIWEAFKEEGWTFRDHPIGLFGIDASEAAIMAIRAGDMFKASLFMDIIKLGDELYDKCVQTALMGLYDESESFIIVPMDMISLNNINIIKTP